MKLLMEAEEATLYDLENGYYVTQEHCSWIHQGYRLMIRPMGDCYLPSIFIDYDSTTPNFKIQTASYGFTKLTSARCIIFQKSAPSSCELLQIISTQ